jgi:hypothetical protein
MATPSARADSDPLLSPAFSDDLYQGPRHQILPFIDDYEFHSLRPVHVRFPNIRAMGSEGLPNAPLIFVYDLHAYDLIAAIVIRDSAVDQTGYPQGMRLPSFPCSRIVQEMHRVITPRERGYPQCLTVPNRSEGRACTFLGGGLSPGRFSNMHLTFQPPPRSPAVTGNRASSAIPLGAVSRRTP